MALLLALILLRADIVIPIEYSTNEISSSSYNEFMYSNKNTTESYDSSFKINTSEDSVEVGSNTGIKKFYRRVYLQY
jgi:hypothetical protein